MYDNKCLDLKLKIMFRLSDMKNVTNYDTLKY